MTMIMIKKIDNLFSILTFLMILYYQEILVRFSISLDGTEMGIVHEPREAQCSNPPFARLSLLSKIYV